MPERKLLFLPISAQFDFPERQTGFLRQCLKVFFKCQHGPLFVHQGCLIGYDHDLNFLWIKKFLCKVDKFFRIRTTLEPVINEGRLFVPEHMTELLADLRGFPTIQHIDRIDCLASAVALIPQRPLPQKQKDEADALASYLRNKGVSSHLIESRIKELYR